MRHLIKLREISGERRDAVLYDTAASTLTWLDGTPVALAPLGTALQKGPMAVPAPAVNGAALPGRKSTHLRRINIQLGLTCNYSCSYCLQRHQPEGAAAHVDDVAVFMSKMDGWYDGGRDGKGAGTEIRFWGGEPFAYWKMLRPLGLAVARRYPNARLAIITNGSILTPVILDWLDECNISIAISHDGPGQHLRGPDPFDDPKRRENILAAYDRLSPNGRVSFNCVLTREHHDLAAIYDWFAARLEGRPLHLTTEGMVTPYHDEGVDTAPAWMDVGAISARIASSIISGKGRAFGSVRSRLTEFHQSLVDGRRADGLGSKCGMERPDYIAVTLAGDVITCQNVSTAATAPNGQSHVVGHVDQLDDVRLTTMTSWQYRENCRKCPVVQLCKGNCSFLQDRMFAAACAASKSYESAILAAALFFLTGMVPEQIETIDDAALVLTEAAR